MPPTLANGKICYLEIPAADIARFGRLLPADLRVDCQAQRGDGSTAFDDAVGEVSGSWRLGRPPSSEPGLLLYIMVDSVAATLEKIVAHGGEIAQPIGADVPRSRPASAIPRAT